eukprot:CAMPEP_0172160402 /NCGR_PEP_ID=MMETSP1050-20130122/5538_1 /TAXON_ID=233186 /ORGANISM="Cryptomonas curvata, Strain CCAP979/52" /LENGTH=140 /DNA_ID=CAMNT_0012830161 /DNA_START=65 /DNA_END=488 /DNA_ORIENTATION=+
MRPQSNRVPTASGPTKSSHLQSKICEENEQGAAHGQNREAVRNHRTTTTIWLGNSRIIGLSSHAGLGVNCATGERAFERLTRAFSASSSNLWARAAGRNWRGTNADAAAGSAADPEVAEHGSVPQLIEEAETILRKVLAP